ncbi:MAG: hypothetical protein ACRDQB_07550 [Thermocrispum sp.]
MPRRRVGDVVDEIRRRVDAGEWAEFPTISTLAAELRTSAGTVLKALPVLADSGLIRKTRALQYTARWVYAGGDLADHREYRLTVADRISERVESGAWPELPGITAMAAELGMSHTGVRMGLAVLAERGRVFQDFERSGRGQWRLLQPDGTRPPTRLEEVSADMRDKIASGEWAVFPRVIELQRWYPVAAPVVNAAVRQLGREGLIVQLPTPGKRWAIASHVTEKELDGLCSVAGCRGQRFARGMCFKHDWRTRTYGSTELPLRVPRRCEVAGCGRKRHSHGLCSMHYARFERFGSTELPRKRCMVDGCDGRHVARGWCRRHYNEWWHRERGARDTVT